jgi:hypothetical protein
MLKDTENRIYDTVHDANVIVKDACSKVLGSIVTQQSVYPTADANFILMRQTISIVNRFQSAKDNAMRMIDALSNTGNTDNIT